MRGSERGKARDLGLFTATERERSIRIELRRVTLNKVIMLAIYETRRRARIDYSGRLRPQSR